MNSWRANELFSGFFAFFKRDRENKKYIMSFFIEVFPELRIKEPIWNGGNGSMQKEFLNE